MSETYDYKTDHLYRLRQLLKGDRARVIIAPKGMEMMHRWPMMSDAEKRAADKGQVEYLAVGGTNGSSPKSIFDGGGGNNEKHIMSRFARTIETPDGPGTVNRIKTSVIPLIHELISSKAEFGKNIEVFDSSVHPYPVISGIKPDQLKFTTAEVNGEDVLLIQVIGEQRLRELNRSFVEFGLWEDKHVQSHTSWSDDIHTVVMKDVPPYFIDVLAHEYPDHFMDDLGTCSSVHEAMQFLIDEPVVKEPPPPPPVEKKQRAVAKPTEIFRPMPKEQLVPLLKNMGTKVKVTRGLNGLENKPEIFIANPLSNEETRYAIRSLIYHATNGIMNETIEFSRSHGGLSYAPTLTANALKAVEGMCRKKEIIPVSYSIDTLHLPDDKANATLDNGILSLTDIPVFIPVDGWELPARGQPAQQKKPKEIGRISLHVAPVKLARKNTIQILVNSPMGGMRSDDSRRQAKPILDLLRLNQNDLEIDCVTDTFRNYSRISVTIPNDAVYANVCKAFKLDKPIAINELLEHQTKDKPEWIDGYKSAELLFVTQDAQQGKRGKRITVKSGRYRGPKDDKGTATVQERTAKDHKKDRATDEFAENIKQMMDDELPMHQKRFHAEINQDGVNYTLYLVLTKDEYRSLQGKISGARNGNTNRSGLKFVDIEPRQPEWWDTDHVRLVACKIHNRSIAEGFQKSHITSFPTGLTSEKARDAFIAHVRQQAKQIKAESQRQQTITVDPIEAFAEAMAKGRAAVGYVEYPSFDELEHMIAQKKVERDRIAKYKEYAATIGDFEWENQKDKIRYLSADIKTDESNLESDRTQILADPSMLVEDYNEYISELEEVQLLVKRYAVAPDQKVELPVILAHGDPVVKDRSTSDGRGNKERGLFQVLSASINDKKWLHGADDESGLISKTWNTAYGMQIIDAQNQIRIFRTKKEKDNGAKGSPAAWFLVSPELARAAKLRAEEMIERLGSKAEVDSVKEIPQTVSLSSIPFQTTFYPTRNTEVVDTEPHPERELSRMRRRATLVYETQNHELAKTRVNEEHRGAQPVLYVMTNSAIEVRKLVQELDDADLLIGQKHYSTSENKVLSGALNRYKEECRPLRKYLDANITQSLKAMIEKNPEAIASMVEGFSLRNNPFDDPDAGSDVRRIMRERITEPLYRKELAKDVVEGIKRKIGEAEREYAQKLAQISATPGLTEALEAEGFKTLVDAYEVPLKKELQVGVDEAQVQLVKPDGSAHVMWVGDKEVFQDALEREFVPGHSQQFVKIYLKPSIQNHQALGEWRAELHSKFNAMAKELRGSEGVSAEGSDASETQRPSGMRERIMASRATHTDSRMAKMESPDDAARKMAAMTADKRGHEPAYIEGIWAGMHADSLGHIAQARLEQRGRQ